MVHHTGTGPARPTAEDVANYQISGDANWAFPGIAYTLYVDPTGSIAVCWDLEAETWSQGLGSPSVDANDEGINNLYGLSICFSGQDPTDAQWAAIEKAKAALDQILGRSLVLTGHRLVDPGTTECPGNVAAARLHAP